MIWNLILNLLYLFAGYYLTRVSYVFISGKLNKSASNKKTMMLIFGSGGHTTELLMTFKNFDFTQWQKIYFVKAETDITSENKIKDYVSTNKVTLDF
jgi:hypothetical protein